MSNFDLLNRQCDDVILISDNYCLDSSFEILVKNFEFFENKLNSINKQDDKVSILKSRFDKNKQKYYKFITFVNQFSASLENVHAVFNRQRDTWQTKNTPLEIIYNEVVPITRWGTFNNRNGEITRNQNIISPIKKQIIDWVNQTFIEEQYGIYGNLRIRVYLSADITDTFTFNGRYDETCDAGGGSRTVCCNPCGDPRRPSRGCNRMGTIYVDGVRKQGPGGCGDLGTWCPPAVHDTTCATGTCKGWGGGYNPRQWRSHPLRVSRTIQYNDRYLIGYDTLDLIMDSRSFLWKENI